MSALLFSLCITEPVAGQSNGTDGQVIGNASISITKLEPTVFFPKLNDGELLKQIAKLGLKNPGPATAAHLKISLKDKLSYTEDLGFIEAGETAKNIHILDITEPTELTLELYKAGNCQPEDTLQLIWQPQRKWKIYCAPFSHHDLGYANYYHILRRTIREAGIEKALEFCRLTDDWDDDSKYRWTVETSEPITGYIERHTKVEVDELIRRIKEGRIELGGCHNTASTEAMSYELLARLFYTPNRYVRDLLGIEPRKTGLINDVVGLTRSLPLYTKEAGILYFYHGRNRMANCMLPASKEPVFYWLGPDGDTRNMTLFRTTIYYSSDRIRDCNEREIQGLVMKYENREDWIYDSILSDDTRDFSTPSMNKVTKIRAWNKKWNHPRIIFATMTMFFDGIAAQADAARIATFTQDSPNPWIDQDTTDAKLAGAARRLGYEIPTTERLATIAMVLAGNGYPWRDIWQAYNRLLMYHEHTNAPSVGGEDYYKAAHGKEAKAHARYYETEKMMHRALVWESQEFCDKARENTLTKLEALITTKADKTLIVLNPLNWERTDIVRFSSDKLPNRFCLIDNATGKSVPTQKLPDGTIIFEAGNVPSMGYKTFRIVPDAAMPDKQTSEIKATQTILENRFFKITFDLETGGITNIHDKQLNVELVDQDAQYKFNEYLYQRYETDKYEDDPKSYHPESAILSHTTGPVAGVMTANVRAFGCGSIGQIVTLYNNIKRIDFVVNLDKSPSGRTFEQYSRNTCRNKEALYYTFPFSIPESEVKHELAGAVVEPGTNQFEGSCTTFYGIQHFSDISNDRYGVTVATIEAPLIEYDRPRPGPWRYWRQRDSYESDLGKPTSSHIYLYLLNNMFFTNVYIDQQGPMAFTWSIRSHRGNWKDGKAYRFGWNVSHPLIAQVKHGAKHGALPADKFSFLQIDKPNVVCTTIKPAEANGSGIILRFNELAGRKTIAKLTFALLGKIKSVIETDLVENDRMIALEVVDKNQIEFSIRPHGVKTIRVDSQRKSQAPVKQPTAKAVSDMQVDLSWQINGRLYDISHYNIYRSTEPDFEPSLRSLIGRSVNNNYSDRPKLNYGGWINNRLEAETTYYYKVAAVDRYNHQGPVSNQVKVVTLKAGEKNAVPSRVEGLYVTHVSPLTDDNFLNLWFYTNCESDVTGYQIHRSTTADFVPDDSTLLKVIDVTRPVNPLTLSGASSCERLLSEYNRQMYMDESVLAGKTYYYKVCAFDSAGNIGPYSKQAVAQTRPQAP